MPRSSKAPPLPPEPDVNELIQNDVARIKRLLGLDVNRLALGSEVEGIVVGSPFGTADYTITGVNTIELVNVTTSLVGGVQTGYLGDITAPGQVAGLAVTTISTVRLDLAWTANTELDLDHYNIYRGTTAGFAVTLGTTTPLSQPVTNSYNNTGLIAGTTYYYKVSAVDASGNIGVLSTEKSATTSPPDTTPPGQTTGLTASAVLTNTISLNWTANTAPDLDHYNVYRGTSSGFIVTLGTTVPVGTPTVNSYADTGRTTSTTYYYRVSAVDTSGNIGALSTETNATAAIIPSLELHFNNSYVDTSPNAYLIAGTNNNGFTSIAGAFGSAGWACNSPTYTAGNEDWWLVGSGSPIPLQMDTTIGFSISLWVYPTTLSAITKRRVIIEKGDDTANNKWTLQMDSAGILYFFVRKAGTDYKVQISGFTTGSWQHIGAIFNGATNTATVYRNGVAGSTSSATPQYDTNVDEFALHIGVHMAAPLSDSRYQGYLDEIRYYKSIVLTSTQITNLKNTNAP